MTPRFVRFGAAALLLGLSLTGVSAWAAEPAAGAAPARKFTCVIAHGAWAGGWEWREVDRLLTADGHKVYRPTLTGLGERVHLSNPDINLTTHITDIVNVFLWEDLHDTVLVGHSYGGMVITGVADRVPDRIKQIIYVDAFLPENGESLESSFGPGRTPRTHPDGYPHLPGDSADRPIPHTVPHPAKTLTEPVKLTNQDAVKKIPTTYILTVDKGKQPEEDGFYRFYERAKARGWTVEIMEGDHVVQRSHPKELVELLEKAP